VPLRRFSLAMVARQAGRDSFLALGWNLSSTVGYHRPVVASRYSPSPIVRTGTPVVKRVQWLT
jgi:hypothetical protein